MEDIPLNSVVQDTSPPEAGTAAAPSDAPVPRSDPQCEQRLRKLRDAWFTGIQFLDNPGIEAKWTLVPALDHESERVRVHWFEDVFRAQTAHYSGPGGGDALAAAILARPSLLNLCWGTKHTLTNGKLCGTRVIETFQGNLSLVEFSIRKTTVFPWVQPLVRTLVGLVWHRHDPSRHMHIFLFHEYSPTAVDQRSPSVDQRSPSVDQRSPSVDQGSTRFCLVIQHPQPGSLGRVTVYASDSLLRKATGGQAAEHLRAVILGWEQNIIK